MQRPSKGHGSTGPALALLSTAPAVGLVLILSLVGGCPDSPPDPPGAAFRKGDDLAEQRVWSVQLHVHGSFSEGLGSIDSHSREARELGVDVIWWSDHDFRIASYRHVSSFGFDGGREPLDRGEPWRLRPDRFRESGATKQLRPPRQQGRTTKLAVEFTDTDPREGRASLRVRAAHPGSVFESYLTSFNSFRGLHRRSLASQVALRISLLAETTGPDVRALVEVGLSEHTSSASGELELHTLRYVCRDGTPLRRDAVYEIPLECPPDRWSDHRLDVSSDAVRGFPEFPGEDNSLHEIRFGVESRRDAIASARFDRLRIEQQHFGEASYARQRELIDEVSVLHPGPHQLQGVEISYAAAHLNEFSVDTRLLDYDQLIRDSDQPGVEPPIVDSAGFKRFVLRRAVAAGHERGGLVSYNHMFGTARTGGVRNDPEATLSRLVANRLHGAELLEVGYRRRGGNTLEDHLWVWDQLALTGLRLVGIGVSDSHGGPEERWRSAPNNFVSWVEAASPSKRDLIEGLRAGRVFFGDIVLFDGVVDLSTPDGARMGETVVTTGSTAQVVLEADGLAAGDRIHVVEGGGRTATHVAAGAQFRADHTVDLSNLGDGGGFVRFEVYDENGRAKVFSNPIYFTQIASQD
jgi:hypothetical protein